MNDAETAELVARAAAGDDTAFRGLVSGHSALVYRWAVVVAGDRDDADDLAQAVWIKVHRNLRSYRGEARFTSWLYRITANTAIEMGRKQQRRVAALREWPVADEETDGSETGEREERGDELAVQVREFLADLAPRQREVFTLADLGGLPTAVIAEMLEIEESTVRVTLMRARRLIRARLLRERPVLMEELLS